jgi:hypothetical protein
LTYLSNYIHLEHESSFTCFQLDLNPHKDEISEHDRNPHKDEISEVSPELEFSIMLCKQYTKDDSFAYFPVSTWSVLLGTVLLDLLLIRHAS